MDILAYRNVLLPNSKCRIAHNKSLYVEHPYWMSVTIQSSSSNDTWPLNTDFKGRGKMLYID